MCLAFFVKDCLKIEVGFLFEKAGKLFPTTRNNALFFKLILISFT